MTPHQMDQPHPTRQNSTVNNCPAPTSKFITNEPDVWKGDHFRLQWNNIYFCKFIRTNSSRIIFFNLYEIHLKKNVNVNAWANLAQRHNFIPSNLTHPSASPGQRRSIKISKRWKNKKGNWVTLGFSCPMVVFTKIWPHIIQ